MLDLLFYSFLSLFLTGKNLTLAGLRDFCVFQAVVWLQQFFIYKTPNHFLLF